MKKLLLIFISLLMIGCSFEERLFLISNTSDYDVEIEHDGNIFFSKANTEMEINGDSYKDFNLKTSHPVKMIRADHHLTISNDYKTSTLNVKNSTSNNITFKIKNNPDVVDFSIDANSEKTFSLKTDAPTISDSSCKYYTMNQDAGEWNLIFY